MTVPVSALEPPQKLQWIGTVGFRWVFEGQPTFELHPLTDERTEVINHEQVSGFLIPFVLTDTPEQEYDRMNQALKERIEQEQNSQ